jgi:hypothetical protein
MSDIGLKEATFIIGAVIAFFAMLTILFMAVGAVLLIILDAVAGTTFFTLTNAFLCGIGLVVILSIIFYNREKVIVYRTAKCWRTPSEEMPFGVLEEKEG